MELIRWNDNQSFLIESFICSTRDQFDLYNVSEKFSHPYISKSSPKIENYQSGAKIHLTLTDVDEEDSDMEVHELFCEMASLEGVEEDDPCWTECARYF